MSLSGSGSRQQSDEAGAQALDEGMSTGSFPGRNYQVVLKGLH